MGQPHEGLRQLTVVMNVVGHGATRVGVTHGSHHDAHLLEPAFRRDIVDARKLVMIPNRPPSCLRAAP